MAKRPRLGIRVSMALAVAVALSVGCQYEEQVCSEGEYPVKSRHGPGRACATEGKPLPHGYTTYGPGQTPTEP